MKNPKDYPLARPALRVLQGGMQTTVQDLGRYGYQQYGMPVAGAMDTVSYRLGQALVGNAEPLGALECTMNGPRLECLSETVVAFTGAMMNPKINNQPVAMYEAHRLQVGDVISTDFATRGMRMYMAFQGGIDVPVINQSVSTHTKSGIGGYFGRALQAQDVLGLGPAGTFHPRVYHGDTYRVSHWDFTKRYNIVWGPQEDAFTIEGIMTFLRSQYRIGPVSDRMGFRLEGTPVEHVAGADIISDGILFGSVQIPADGQPIILMADRQTTGGYTKIATVITADLPRLAQAPLGTPLQFRPVRVEEAQTIYKEERAALEAELARILCYY